MPGSGAWGNLEVGGRWHRAEEPYRSGRGYHRGVNRPLISPVLAELAVLDGRQKEIAAGPGAAAA